MHLRCLRGPSRGNHSLHLETTLLRCAASLYILMQEVFCLVWSEILRYVSTRIGSNTGVATSRLRRPPHAGKPLCTSGCGVLVVGAGLGRGTHVLFPTHAFGELSPEHLGLEMPVHPLHNTRTAAPPDEMGWRTGAWPGGGASCWLFELYLGWERHVPVSRGERNTQLRFGCSC